MRPIRAVTALSPAVACDALFRGADGTRGGVGPDTRAIGTHGADR